MCAGSGFPARGASVVLDAVRDAAGAGAHIAADIADILADAADGVAGGQAEECDGGECEKGGVFHRPPF